MRAQINPIFKDFAEFWHYTRSLDKTQREIIFTNLDSKEQNRLKRSYERGGWEDVFFRDILDSFLDDTRKSMKFDILDSRCRVLKGKSVYVNKSTWDHVTKYLSQFNDRHTYYLIGGIVAEQYDDKAVLLLPENSVN